MHIRAHTIDLIEEKVVQRDREGKVCAHEQASEERSLAG